MSENLSMSEKELLKFAIENGIIDTALVQEKVDMQKRANLLEKHPYKIWQGADGQWRTYLPDVVKGRVLRKRNSRVKIEDAVVEYWQKHESEDTGNLFSVRFNKWVERQEKCGISNNTICKYWADYKRFFQGEEIENMPVESIDADYVEEYFADKIRETNIPYRSVIGIFGYVNGVFEKSVRDRIITENPCRFVDTKVFKRCCTDDNTRDKAGRILSVDETNQLVSFMKKKISDSPDYIQQYVVLLAIYTGMRVGELAAITWDCVSFADKYILVNKSEKYDRKEKRHYIAKTKNEKIRYVPMSEAARDVLKEIRKVQAKNGWLTEYVFSNENGQIHAKALSECARKRTRMAGIGEKSIHSIRRSFNSEMRCNGVSATVAASILGHSERVNQENYTYDVTQQEYKLSIVNALARQAT